ncbi:MAG: AEC family transporter [Candidatus Kapabacteria bacterium]|nr:AEC family transporter [Candidatus Kapabacteria bacterium]
MTDVFLRLAVITAAGIAYRYLPGALPPADIRRIISSIVLNVFIPFLTFAFISTAPVSSDLITVPIVSVASALLGFGVGWLVYAKLLARRLTAPAIGSLILASAWCNAMYMGLPITTAVVGEHVGRVPILFDYLGMTPLLFTVGAVMSSHYGTRQTTASLGKGIVEVLRLPPIIAIALGIVVNILDVTPPSWLLSACEGAGKVVAPLMLFSIGLALRLPTGQSILLLIPSALIRTVLVPLIVMPLAGAIIMDRDVLQATMLETAMPTMMLTMVFAERFGLDESVLAQAILVSTLLSVFTLPQVLAWIP